MIFRRYLQVYRYMHEIMGTSNPVLAFETLKRKTEVITPEENDDKNKKLKTEITTDIVGESTVSINKSTNRTRKPKKSALLLCYLGKKYFGMQRNHGVRTVEEDLLKALLEAGIILPNEHECPKAMKFQRAARTDKGVSAVRQVVSLKIPLNDIAETLPEKVNQYLPPEIKILCVKRVTQAFDAKIACDARTYSYMLPTFAFSESTGDENYRITDERIQEVNDFLKTYIGTHNFYNFTSGRLPNDASCNRYILSSECGQPFLKEGLEFVIIKIKGQSFMLHQIRKMIGLAIAVLQRFVLAKDILDKVWNSNRVDIPMAPGLGLMLEDVHYDWYNKKFGGDGLHEPLKWDSCQDVVNDFREQQIYKNIALTERNEKSMMQWLQTLPYHTFDVRESKPPSELPEEKTESKPLSELPEGKTESNPPSELPEEKTESKPPSELPEEKSESKPPCELPEKEPL